MAYNIWIFLMFSVVANAENCTDFYSCQIELYENVLSRSRPSVRPIENLTAAIDVRLGFSLIDFVAVNEDDSSITIRAHLNQTWTAILFRWNPETMKNVQQIRLPAHLVWVPKVDLVNPTEITDYEANNYVTIQSNGNAEFSYSTLLKIPCKFNFQNYPFDEQNCTFRLGSSFYNSKELTISRAIDVIINDGNLVANGFYFVSHAISKQTDYFAGYEPYYDQINIDLIIRRQVTFIVLLINWSATLLMFLSFTGFFLSPLGSERIIFVLVVFLSQFILLFMFSLHLPKNLGPNWPQLGKLLFYDIFFTGLVLVLSAVIRICICDKRQTMEPVPSRIRTLFFQYFAKLVGLNKSSYKTIVLNRENKYETNDDTTGDSALEPLTSVSNGSSITTADTLVESTQILSKDVGSIKQKLNLHFHQKALEQEWFLLARIVDRICLPLYLFLFSISIANHLFYK